jgi:hypothetical protein
VIFVRGSAFRPLRPGVRHTAVPISQFHAPGWHLTGNAGSALRNFPGGSRDIRHQPVNCTPGRRITIDQRNRKGVCPGRNFTPQYREREVLTTGNILAGRPGGEILSAQKSGAKQFHGQLVGVLISLFRRVA